MFRRAKGGMLIMLLLLGCVSFSLVFAMSHSSTHQGYGGVTRVPPARPLSTPASGTFRGLPLYGNKTPGVCATAFGTAAFLLFYDFGVNPLKDQSAPLATLINPVYLSSTPVASFCNDYWPKEAETLPATSLAQVLHWPDDFFTANTQLSIAATAPVPTLTFHGNSAAGSCASTVSTAATIYSYDFPSGSGYPNLFYSSGKLNDPTSYQGSPTYTMDDFSDVFCNDYWPAQNEIVPALSLLQTLHWPADYFPPVMASSSVSIGASLPAPAVPPTYTPNDAHCTSSWTFTSAADENHIPASALYEVRYYLGWGPEQLNPRYQTDTADLFCAEYWPATSETLSEAQLLQLLHWPADLFAGTTDSLAKTYIAVSHTPPGSQQHIGPYDSEAPFAQEQASSPTPAANASCFWNVDNAAQTTVNICDPIRQAINATAGFISQIYQNNADTLAFLWRTPLDAFQNDKASGLLTIWRVCWVIVLIFLTAVIAWGALRSMVGSVVSFLSYAQLTELLPRLFFALLAALLSRQFFLMLLQANNAFSGVFSSTTLQTIVSNPNPGIKLGLVQIAYGLLGFALIIEEAVRLALIYVLFAGSPILFFFAALPETQRLAIAGATASIFLIFLQAVQSFTMDVGNRILVSTLQHQTLVHPALLAFAGTPSSARLADCCHPLLLTTVSSSTPTFLQVLLAIAVLYLTLVEFFALLRLAFGSAGFALSGGPLAALAIGQWAVRRGGRGLSNASRAFGLGAAATTWGSFRGTAAAINALDRALHGGRHGGRSTHSGRSGGFGGEARSGRDGYPRGSGGRGRTHGEARGSRRPDRGGYPRGKLSPSGPLSQETPLNRRAGPSRTPSRGRPQNVRPSRPSRPGRP